MITILNTKNGNSVGDLELISNAVRRRQTFNKLLLLEISVHFISRFHSYDRAKSIIFILIPE